MSLRARLQNQNLSINLSSNEADSTLNINEKSTIFNQVRAFKFKI